MARWAALLEKRRDERPVMLVDAGDFCAVGKMRDQETKDRYFFEAVEKLDYDALAVAENEILFGRQKLLERAGENHLPLLSSNILDRESGKHIFDRTLVSSVGGSGFLFFRRGGVKVGLFSVADPRIIYGADRLVEKYYEVVDPRIAALDAVTDLRKRGCEIIIALSHQEWDLSADFAREVGGIDIVVVSHSSMAQAKSELIGDVLLVAPGSSRTSFTEIEVSWGEEGVRTGMIDHGKELLGMKGHPEFAEIEKRYVEETGDTGEIKEIK